MLWINVEFTSGGRILQMPVFSAIGRILLINPRGSEKSSQLGSNTGHSGGGTNSANADMILWFLCVLIGLKNWKVELDMPLLFPVLFFTGNLLHVHHDPSNPLHEWLKEITSTTGRGGESSGWGWLKDNNQDKSDFQCFPSIHGQARECLPALSYSGQRAGSIQPAIIAPHRQQPHKNLHPRRGQHLDRGRWLNLKKRRVNTKQSGFTAMAVVLCMLCWHLCTWVVHDFSVMVHFQQSYPRPVESYASWGLAQSPSSGFGEHCPALVSVPPQSIVTSLWDNRQD